MVGKIDFRWHKNGFVPSMLLALAGLLVLAATFGRVVGAGVPLSPATNKSGTISADETWTAAGSPYVLLDRVTVNAGVTLTIDPNVEVRGDGISSQLIIQGDLQAVGTAAQPIIFTSNTDTAPDQWEGLWFDGGSGSLEYVTVRYGGNNSPSGSRTAILASGGSSLTLNHAQIISNTSYVWPSYALHILNGAADIIDSNVANNGDPAHNDIAVMVNSGSAVNMTNTMIADSTGVGLESTGKITLTNVIFDSNSDAGMRIEFDDLARASGLTFVNDEAALTAATLTLSATIPLAWGADHYTMEGILVVDPLATLTVEQGVVMRGKDTQSNLRVQGTLLANGSSGQPILFTSSADSAPAQWRGIWFDGGIGALDHIILRHGGRRTVESTVASAIYASGGADISIQNSQIISNTDPFWPSYSVLIDGSTAAVSDTTIAYGGDGAHSDVAMNVIGSSEVTVTNSEIRDNIDGGLQANGTITLTNVIFDNNTGTGMRIEFDDLARASGLSFINDEAALTAATLDQDAVIPAVWGAARYALEGQLFVNPTATLTIEPGITLRGKDIISRLNVQGSLIANGTAGQPILFTSVADSGANQWDGIWIDGGSAFLDYVTVRYGGNYFSGVPGNVAAALYASGGAVLSIQNSHIHSNTDPTWNSSGIRASGSVLTVTDTIIANNGDTAGQGDSGLWLDSMNAQVTCAAIDSNGDEGVHVSGSNNDIVIAGSTISANSNYGLNNVSSDQVDATYNYWGHPTGPYHAAQNPAGQGNEVTGNVLFAPWLATSQCAVPLGNLTASNDGPTIESLPTQLTASLSTGTGVTYTWDFGDGNGGQGQTVSHLYPAAGGYTATVVASSSINVLTATTQVTILPRPSFGGVVWHDQDGDGALGPGEQGLGGATVTADGPGGFLGNTSAIDGSFNITTSVQGWYTVTATLAGYGPTTPNPLNLPLPSQGSAQVDFGMIAQTAPGAGRINGRAFADGNGNGAADAGESPFSGLLVNLLQTGSVISTTATDANGLFDFDSLAAGAYGVSAMAPSGYFPSPLTNNGVVVALGQTTFSNLGFLLGGTIGGTVTDAGGTGIANVLFDLEQPQGSVIDSAVSDSAGFYQMGPFNAGTYYLRITLPAGLSVPNGQGLRQVILANNSAAVENWTLDTLGTLNIWTRMWLSSQYVPIAGVNVTVVGPFGYSQMHTTDYAGRIVLAGLPGGGYSAEPITTSLPMDAVISPAVRTGTVSSNASTNFNFNVDLGRGIKYYCQRAEGSTSPPFGAAFPCTVETRVITDTLGTPAGTLIDSAALTGFGFHLFGDMAPGLYEVDMIPDHSVPGQENWPDHNEQLLVNGSTIATVRYPYNPNYASTSIWGFAFEDVNLSGTAQSSEKQSSSSNGITVELFDDNWNLLETTVTAQYLSSVAGRYEFPGLSAGTYHVKISLPTGFGNTTPTSYVREVNLTQYTEQADFGYRRYFGASVSGYVFFDNDADGRYDPDYDDPVGGVTVTLKTPLAVIEDTYITPSSGYYTFYPIASGEYVVSLSAPPGSAGATLLDVPVGLPSGQASAAVDFPLVPTDGRSRVVVFVDDNLDGIPSPGEQRIGGAGVIHHQINCGASSCPVDGTAFTDSGGVATFMPRFATPGLVRVGTSALQMANPFGAFMPANSSVPVWIALVPPGTLSVQPFWDVNGNMAKDGSETTLSGVLVTVAGQGSATTTAGGVSFTLSEGSYDVTVDPPAGMSRITAGPILAPFVSASGTTLLPVPLRYDGAVSGQVLTLGGNASWTGLTVELEDLNGPAARQDQVSSSNNSFLFENVPGGAYRLSIVNVPPGYRLDAEPAFNYSAGDAKVQNLTLIPLGDIFGEIYLDGNGNGVKEPNEQGVSNYDVYLLSSDGSPAQQVSVAADGSFIVPDLLPNVQYALTTDLVYAGYGPPGAAISEAPGWFSVNNQNVQVRLGVFPWDPDDANFNVVLGNVYYQNGNVEQPVAGAEVGYYNWSNSTGCSNSSPNPIGTTISDVDGRYRLDTNFLPGPNYYCVVVLGLPGFQGLSPQVVSTNYTYQSSGGAIVQPRIDANKDLEVEQTAPLALRPSTPQAGGAVSVDAFLDTNINGYWDAGELALPGVSVSDGSITATTGADGSAVLSLVADGERALVITGPSGYVPVGVDSVTVWMNSADLELPPIPFRLAGALAGMVYVDFDGDGWQGTGNQERPLADVAVTLTGPIVTGTLSSGNGTFLFLGLPQGAYTLSVTAPVGFAPAPDQIVTVDADGGAARVGLGPLGQVSGVVYQDWDGDGRRGADEAPTSIPVTMTLESVEESRLFGGNFLFFDVNDGAYNLLPNWSAVQAVSVTLASDTAAGHALPAAEPGAVRGTLWHDVNGDGLRQPWEAPLSGVIITLDGITVTTTSERGQFFFAGVGDGAHTLEATLPSGLEAAIPPFPTTGERGAAVSIAAIKSTGYQVYLPMVVNR